MSDNTQATPSPFYQFLDEFKSSMKRAFHGNDSIDRFCSTRGLPPAVLNELLSSNPLALAIPVKYGGMGGTMRENLTLLSAAAYESLSLSLTFAINNALFLQPLAKYGQETAKARVFKQFIRNGSMGGLMITEPGFGSDALSMQTSFTEVNGNFHLKGTKHWAGLTGMADFWLVAARRKSENGSLMRDIDLFISDNHSPEQKIVVEEYFENLGLYQIPYGKNQIDISLPEDQRLIPQTTGIKMLLDLLHRSRYQFPGLGLGFIQRMLDEAISHTQNRMVGNQNLFGYDQVQNRLSRMQASFTICSAFCLKSGETAGIDADLFHNGLEANIIKSVTADMMADSAQSLLQLVGAKGYKLNHIAGRSVVDSRPFQIFEGSNDILYHQIGESVLKQMKGLKVNSLAMFLKGFVTNAATRIHDMTSFSVEFRLPQRKLVDFGKAISRIVSMDLVLHLEEKGFRKDLINNALEVLTQETSSLLNTFRHPNNAMVVEDYQENSAW